MADFFFFKYVETVLLISEYLWNLWLLLEFFFFEKSLAWFILRFLVKFFEDLYFGVNEKEDPPVEVSSQIEDAICGEF